MHDHVRTEQVDRVIQLDPLRDKIPTHLATVEHCTPFSPAILKKQPRLMDKCFILIHAQPIHVGITEEANANAVGVFGQVPRATVEEQRVHIPGFAAFGSQYTRQLGTYREDTKPDLGYGQSDRQGSHKQQTLGPRKASTAMVPNETTHDRPAAKAANGLGSSDTPPHWPQRLKSQRNPETLSPALPRAHLDAPISPDSAEVNKRRDGPGRNYAS